jgi:hypothetical protein
MKILYFESHHAMYTIPIKPSISSGRMGYQATPYQSAIPRHTVVPQALDSLDSKLFPVQRDLFHSFKAEALRV